LPRFFSRSFKASIASALRVVSVSAARIRSDRRVAIHMVQTDVETAA
jgi:hypothetical protein